MNLQEKEEGTRVKEVYLRNNKPIDIPDGSLMLTKKEIIASLAADVYRIPFSNTKGEITYPSRITEHSDKIVVELEDGSTFEVMIDSIKYE